MSEFLQTRLKASGDCGPGVRVRHPVLLGPADAEIVEAYRTYQQSHAFSDNTIRRRRLAFIRFAAHMPQDRS